MEDFQDWKAQKQLRASDKKHYLITLGIEAGPLRPAEIAEWDAITYEAYQGTSNPFISIRKRVVARFKVQQKRQQAVPSQIRTAAPQTLQVHDNATQNQHL